MDKKHQKLVEESYRIADKIEKKERELMRLFERREKSRRALKRSNARLDKIRAAKVYTTGPTGSVVDDATLERITL
jgi:hypothetical protein